MLPKKQPKKKVAPPKPGVIVNCYDLKGVKKHQTKHINPYFCNHRIKVPLRGVLIGSSGSGKSNLLMNIINQMQSTYNHIYVYTQAREPIYDFLREELPANVLTIKYSLNDLRSFPEDRYYGQSLVVLDDMVNEKDQKVIEELYIRGRKIQGGVSLLYLTQSYYKVPKIVRLQCQYVFILKVSGKRDLNMMLSEYSLGTSKERLAEMYNYACNRHIFGDFMMIDLEAPQTETFRHNFTEIMDGDGGAPPTR